VRKEEFSSENGALREMTHFRSRAAIFLDRRISAYRRIRTQQQWPWLAGQNHRRGREKRHEAAASSWLAIVGRRADLGAFLSGKFFTKK